MATQARRDDAVWVELDPATLAQPIAAAYSAYKALYRQAKAARQEFEAGLEASAKLAEGKRMVFGYNFGKLSVAVVDGERKVKGEAKRAVSLAQFLAVQGVL